MPKPRTEWNAEAEWEVTFFDPIEYRKVIVSEVFAPSESVALLFSFRCAAGDGFDIQKLKHLETKRIN